MGPDVRNSCHKDKAFLSISVVKPSTTLRYTGGSRIGFLSGDRQRWQGEWFPGLYTVSDGEETNFLFFAFQTFDFVLRYNGLTNNAVTSFR